MGAHSRTILACFLFVLLLFAGRAQDISEEVMEFIEAQEKQIQEFAKWAEKQHSDRVQRVKDCQCSKHACSSNFSDAVCLDGWRGPKGMCEIEGKRRLDLKTSIFRFPPGTDPEKLSNSLKESICVYKNIEEEAIKYGDDVYAGVYVGTVDGHFRKYPGYPRERCLKDGEEHINGCLSYDPRLRPWYIAASTGPKDIVLVVDKSASMHDFVNNREVTKWDLVTEAVNGFLETLSPTDFVNVVTFSDDASPLWTESGMVKGTAENLKDLSDRLAEEEPKGQTNFTAAFNAAIPLLGENCRVENANCSNCQKIVLFLTDGRETSQDGESVKPSEMARRIDKLQARLEKEMKRRAAIFTFSISEEADDAIPRQIACANSGAWAFIGPETKMLDALNSYYLYVSAGTRLDSPVWIEVFTDNSGLGPVTGVAMPFYAKGTKSVPDVFLGVAGKDVLLQKLTSDRQTGKEVLQSALIERSNRCSHSDDTPCELQVYRNAHDERSLCLDPFPPTIEEKGGKRSGVCYAFKNRYYRRFVENVSWSRAKANCKKSGGELVSIRGGQELAFVAGLAHLDGSWVGAEKTPTPSFEWLNKKLPKLAADSPFWGEGDPVFKFGDERCAAIDKRGTIGNMFAKACSEKLSYICVYNSKEPCAGRIHEPPKRGYFEVPPLSSCLETEQAVAATRPNYAAVAKLTTDDVMCDLASPALSSDEVLNNKAVICCAPPDKPGYATRTCKQS